MQSIESNQTKTETKPATISQNPLRQLIDKIVYLDLNNYKSLYKVKKCLDSIGANVADCLSKEVNFVITNREINDLTSSSLEKKIKTSPNALNLVSSRVSVINRTQTILEKASKNSPSTDIISTARRLGIKVLSINELERFVERCYLKLKNLDQDNEVSNNNTSINTNEKTSSFKGNDSQIIKVSPKQRQLEQSTHKISKLKSPFLKLESICKQYKPNYQEFNVWHEINFDLNDSKTTESPFQLYFSDNEKEDEENGENGCGLSSSQNRLNEEEFTKIKSPKSSNTLGSTSRIMTSALTNANSVCSRRNSSNKLGLNSAFLNQFQTKRKAVGYCECCKQKFDNLKQHLTSAQHENFDRNMSNFKEIDQYIDGPLNFRNFLARNNLEMNTNSESSINMDEIKTFAKNFNQLRRSLGVSHVQIIQSLDETEKDPIYNEINLARFERLDITPRSTAKMKPTLEKWLLNAQVKLNNRLKTINNSSHMLDSLNNNESDSTKKRKRISLTPKTLRILNEAFNLNSQPNDHDINHLSLQINYDKDLIRLWFLEKANNVKKKIKKYKQETVLLGLTNENSFLNTSGADMNKSFSPNVQYNNRISMPNTRNSNNQTNTPKQKQRTFSLASSFSFSSPSTMFNLSASNELNNSKRLNCSKLLASKIELINGNSHVESIIADDLKKKSGDSTELSFLDEDILN